MSRRRRSKVFRGFTVHDLMQELAGADPKALVHVGVRVEFPAGAVHLAAGPANSVGWKPGVPIVYLDHVAMPEDGEGSR